MSPSAGARSYVIHVVQSQELGAGAATTEMFSDARDTLAPKLTGWQTDQLNKWVPLLLVYLAQHQYHAQLSRNQ